MILETVALLAHSPRSSDLEIDATLFGHICWGGSYSRIRRVVPLTGLGVAR